MPSDADRRAAMSAFGQESQVNVRTGLFHLVHKPAPVTGGFDRISLPAGNRFRNAA